MYHRPLSLSASALIVWILPASAQDPQSSCGSKVVVKRADTLSSIAERCNIEESDIMRANPRIRGSGDLVAGSELQLSTDSSASASTAERLGSAARQAGDALADFAKDLGSSLDDLLQKNPDLQQRLRQLGDAFNMPSVDLSRSHMAVSPESGPAGTTVTITAAGLPKNAPVTIGGGAPHQAYEIIDSARTRADGTLQVSIRVPDWAGTADRVVFVVAGANADWQVRSSPFRVTNTRL